MVRPLRLTLSSCLAAAALAGCHKDTDKGGDNAADTDIDDTVAVDPDEGHDLGSWLSMRATGDGKPAIAYYDRTEDALGYAVGTVSGGSVTWAKEHVDSYIQDNGLNPGDAGKYAALAMGTDGTPWIVYQDTTNGSAKYAHKVADAWTIGIAGTGGGRTPMAGYWNTVAMDGSGNPVAAYYDMGDLALRVVRWNGTAFAAETEITGTDGVAADGTPIPANVGEYAKIAVGPAGTEYIAYYDRANGALKLSMNTGGGSWTTETVDDSADVGQWPDIVIDSGIIYIAYQDVTNQDLKLASGAPGAWTIETVDAGNYAGADAAMYVSGGTPTILEFDGYNNNAVKATKSSGTWSVSKVNGDDGATGYHNEVVTIGSDHYGAGYDYTHRTLWFSAL